MMGATSPVAAADEVDLFAVSPGRGDLAELTRVLPALAAGGVRRFLLREKQLAPDARRHLAGEVAGLCRALGLEFWIAEDVALAQQVGAHGVQLSERSPSPLRVRAQAGALALGISLHRPISRSQEELSVCAHAFLAPVFRGLPKPGASPPDVTPLLPEGFVQEAKRLLLPTYALGGIGPGELPLLARAGVRRVAAIRLFFDAPDPKAAAEAARAMLRGRPPVLPEDESHGTH